MNAFTLTIVSLIAATAAAYGSLLFVNRKHTNEDGTTTVIEANYDLGARVFLVGNATTIALALHIGDIVLLSAQLGLVWFTLPMYTNKRWTCGILAWFAALVIFLGVAHSFHFTASYVGAAASVIAIYGAWLMSKFRFTGMAWCWLVADLIFIAVAILNNLPILGVLAAIFVLHSSMRLLGYNRVGLFSFEK